MKSIVRYLVKVARELTALEDEFFEKKRIKLKPEGATMYGLVNARMIADAGYRVVDASYSYDKDRGDYSLIVAFQRENEPIVYHTFRSFSWGYGGEGPHGLLEFGRIFGLGLDWNKISGGIDIGLPNKATVDLLKWFT